MIYDETTTEIEIPVKKKPESNIVRVDFAEQRRQVTPPQTEPVKPPTPVTHTESLEWFRDFDAETPWTLRLVAVILVLVLSLLIL